MYNTCIELGSENRINCKSQNEKFPLVPMVVLYPLSEQAHFRTLEQPLSGRKVTRSNEKKTGPTAFCIKKWNIFLYSG